MLIVFRSPRLPIIATLEISFDNQTDALPLWSRSNLLKHTRGHQPFSCVVGEGMVSLTSPPLLTFYSLLLFVLYSYGQGTLVQFNSSFAEYCALLGPCNFNNRSLWNNKVLPGPTDFVLITGTPHAQISISLTIPTSILSLELKYVSLTVYNTTFYTSALELKLYSTLSANDNSYLEVATQVLIFAGSSITLYDTTFFGVAEYNTMANDTLFKMDQTSQFIAAQTSHVRMYLYSCGGVCESGMNALVKMVRMRVNESE
jgi:hypothetical protein